MRSLDGALTDPLAQAGPMHPQTVDRVLVQPERRSVINPFVVRIVIDVRSAMPDSIARSPKGFGWSRT